MLIKIGKTFEIVGLCGSFCRSCHGNVPAEKMKKATRTPSGSLFRESIHEKKISRDAGLAHRALLAGGPVPRAVDGASGAFLPVVTCPLFARWPVSLLPALVFVLELHTT